MSSNGPISNLPNDELVTYRILSLLMTKRPFFLPLKVISMIKSIFVFRKIVNKNVNVKIMCNNFTNYFYFRNITNEESDL